MIGQTFGHYQITGKLGAGGMGVVYRARDTSLGRDVALKVLPTDAATNAGARALLLEEARIASTLNHPHICTIYEVGEAAGVTFAAMEYVEGQPLSAQVPEGGLPIELVLRYGVQIADALAHAHERGVVHRDLKTSNVMVTPEGRAKVLDFGLARRLAADELDRATRSMETASPANTLAGTLHYLAPEVLRGRPADARSDIWALGVVLYEMAAGKLPFGGATTYELTSAILRDALPPLPPRVPAGLRAIVQRCLAREPGQRYSRAGEVRAALEAIDTQSGSAPAIAAAALPRAWWRRKWLWATAVLAAVLGVAFWKGPLLVSIGQTEMGPAGPRTSTGGRASANAEANEYFEKGFLFLTAQFDLERSRQMLERAIKLDPKFAEARAWYGFSHLLMVDTGYSNDRTWIYRAEDEIRGALELDPQSARAHSALAAIHFYRGRMDQVIVEAEKALELSPREFDAVIWKANAQIMRGEYAPAIPELRRVLARDPLLSPVRWLLADALRQTGDTSAALREFDKAREQDPRHPIIGAFLANMLLQTGDLAGARAALEQVRAADRGNYFVRAVWATLLALEGQRALARKEMDGEVLKYAEIAPYSTLQIAEFYALTGEPEKATEWLDRAVRNGDERMEWFQRNPLLASLRQHPRFRQVIESLAFQRRQRASGKSQ